MAKNELTVEEKSTLKKMFLASHLVFMSFNMAKMEANGFTMTMEPAIETIYKDKPEEKKAAYERHQQFFNTHAVAFNFIAGLAYAMEKQHAKGEVDADTINNIKAALMGPTAGMFDSLFFNTLRVIAAGIGIGLCSQGNFAGTIIFILLYGVTQSILKWLLLRVGYTTGTSFIDNIFSTGMMSVLSKSASLLGLMMGGAMTATMVNVPLNWTIVTGDTSVVVLDIINGIFPGLLGVILLFVMVNLIKKGWRPTRLILLIFIISFVGAILGIF